MMRIRLGLCCLGAAGIALACGTVAVSENTGQGKNGVELYYDCSYVTGVVPFDNNYNYWTNNCHRRANDALDAAVDIDAGKYGFQGIVACDGQPNGSYGGHTVNWAGPLPVKVDGVTAPGFCLSDIRLGIWVPACCWQQEGSDPDVRTGKGRDCASKVCYQDAGQAVALEAGVRWDLSPIMCTGLDPAACSTCCTDAYNAMIRFVPCQDPSDPDYEKCRTEVTAARNNCFVGCCGPGLVATGLPAPRQVCAAQGNCPTGQIQTNNPATPCLDPAAIPAYCAKYPTSSLCR
jgi:hypothetical protein